MRCWLILKKILLKGNVKIVDTPGIGDQNQEEVAQKMMGYLHKADAIVFVLNVANAGGIQEDRVFIYFSSAMPFYLIHYYPLFINMSFLITISAYSSYRTCQKILTQNAMLLPTRCNFFCWTNGTYYVKQRTNRSFFK